MTWQDRQNSVDWARSICAENPAASASAGTRQSAKNASTLPPLAAVRWTPHIMNSASSVAMARKAPTSSVAADHFVAASER